MKTDQRFRQLVIIASAAVCVTYLVYRGLFTLNVTTPFAAFASVFLYLGEFYGVFVLLLFYVQVWDSREPEELPVLEGRSVDVFVPTYNEDPQLLRATLEACKRMEYPHETYVCDDGKRPAVAELAKELGVHYVIRPDNRHAKAGNLNHIFAKTHGEFIIILDADHVPEPNFITRLIGYFRDDKLGFVQTPHAFYNFDSFQARLDQKNRRYWEEGHLFYEVIQPGRNRWNCPIFAGSAAMFRRCALAEVGYIAVETITEDMHTGMRVNSKGWKSLAISERLVAGQAAPDVTTFHSQRIRWGEGNLSIMAHDNPLTMRGLTWPQRLCYLGSMVHWAGGLFKLAIYLTPILMMFTGVPPVAEFTWLLAIITLIYLFASIHGVNVASNGLGSFLNGELFCMINFWTQIRGTMRAMFWRKFQKFVVTSKRGRQAKSIWPYIRPQVFLIGLSALALVWGWSRLALGISDDYFKPIIPTFWIVFHMMLAFMVLRRALWPEDRRFSTRHLVHLPVSFSYQGVGLEARLLSQSPEWGLHRPEGLGISADVNEIGMTLIAYAPLAVKDRLRLTLRGGENVECDGEIQWMKELSPRVTNDVAVPRGYRYGIAFKDVTPQQLDGLNRLCLHYAVPRMYAEFMEGRQRSSWTRLKQRLQRGFIRRRYEQRVPVHMPVVLQRDGAADDVLYTVTEDASRGAFSVLVSTELSADAALNFTLHTPLGEIQGHARLLRGERKRYAARDYQRCVLEITELFEQGRVTLDSLLFPRAPVRLDAMLQPEKAPLPVPIARPVLIGAAVLLPFMVLELGGFRLTYRDDFFLHDVATRTGPISEDESKRVESLLAAIYQKGFLSNDRLVLLIGAVARTNRTNDLDQLTMLLAPRDRRNLDLQFALAQALDNSHDYEQADQEYQRLLGELHGDRLSESRKRELVLAAARAATHAGKHDTAVRRFQEVLERNPEDNGIRNEFAGVLLGAGKSKEALELYQSVQPDFDGRVLLVAIYTRLKNFDAAEKECRAITEMRPDDPNAKLLLADILSWKQSGQSQSRAIYEQLLKIKGNQPELTLRLAQIALWNKSYDEALQRYQPLVDERLDQAEVVKSYIDAAASADKLGAPQHRTALAIYERVLTAQTDDPVFLARLAWVLQRVKELDKSTVLLDRAVELSPEDPTVRKQLLGALASAGRLKDVLKQLEGKEMDFDTRHMLVGVHVKNQDYVAAEKECQEMLKLRPNDFTTERLLADLWSWSKNYKGSLTLLEKLRREHPEDPELPVRIAEVTLWSGAHDQALERFHSLLVEKFERPEAWRAYADAAASARKLTDAHHAMLTRIWERASAGEVKDVTFVTRLAWVFHVLKDAAHADAALAKAVSLQPQDAAARRELAGVLGATAKYKPAIALFDGVALELEDRYRLADLYSADKQFTLAEKQCRAILQDQPDDVKAVRLLADVLSWNKKYTEALTLFEKLAAADPKNLEVLQRLAEVLLWSGAHDKALARFESLLGTRFDDLKFRQNFVDAAASATKLSDSQARMAQRIGASADQSKDIVFLTRLAWVLQRTKQSAEAAKLLDRALALNPREPKQRRELAGVLAAAGKHKTALQLFKGIPLEPEDRLHMAELYAADKQFPQAAEQVRSVLQDDPEDMESRRFLADILSWNKDYKEALALYEEMADEDRNDLGIALRLAEITLWSGDYEKAMTRLHSLLEINFEQPEVWRCFVDAASSAGKLKPEQLRIAVSIADRALAGHPKDALCLSRLAWVLQRANEGARARAILDLALALKPSDAAVRRELAGVLAAVGKNKEALKLFDGVPLDLQDRYRLIEIYSADQNYPGAEAQCRAILQKDPRDRRALKLLASVLTWKKDYKASLPLLEKLVQENGQDPDLPRLLAEVLLWSGDYEKAAARFGELLEKRFEQPDLWRPFVDAIASASALTDRQPDLIRRIAERVLAGGPADSVFMVRLAWALQRVKQTDKARVLLDRVLAAPPKEPAARKDLARTLAAVGNHVEALRMFENLTLDLNDRYQLVGICGSATRQAKTALEEEPDQKEARARNDYLAGWKKISLESLQLYEQLVQQAPGDRKLRRQLAEMTLWNGDFVKALTYLAALLESNLDQPDLWHCYVDAAASADVPLGDKHKAIVLRVFESMTASETKVEYLSRLAWILYRLGDTARTDHLLDKALALHPEEATVRKELAGVLASAGRYDAAVQMYAGLKLTFADRLRLAEIYAAGKRFDAAEREVRALLGAHFGDAKTQLLFASVLTWNKKFAEADSIYRQLLLTHPNDAQVLAKLAELCLMTGQYDDALAKFHTLLESDADHIQFWTGYIDAAASARQLAESRRQLVLHICRKTLENQSGDPVFLVRLAWVLRRFKELDPSIAILKLSLEKDPTSRTARHQLAETLYERGLHAEAEKHFRVLLRSSPSKPEISPSGRDREVSLRPRNKITVP